MIKYHYHHGQEEQRVIDFNKVKIENHNTGGSNEFDNHNIKTDLIDVYFRNIEDELIKNIEKADAVVGCVAWLTSENILIALSKKSTVQIVVQKEDFLRPDIASGKNFSKRIRYLYSLLNCEADRYMMDFGIGCRIGKCSVACDPSIEAVRCVGNYNKDKNPAFPRSHHKFVVFLKGPYGKIHNKKININEIHGMAYEEIKYEPYAVWSGSFNFTKNATNSLENAVLIKDKQIIEAYLKEWGQIAAISEPLDWESQWTFPEYRIGT
jgi:hypothetical protein